MFGYNVLSIDVHIQLIWLLIIHSDNYTTQKQQNPLPSEKQTNRGYTEHNV